MHNGVRLLMFWDSVSKNGIPMPWLAHHGGVLLHQVRHQTRPARQRQAVPNDLTPETRWRQLVLVAAVLPVSDLAKHRSWSRDRTGLPHAATWWMTKVRHHRLCIPCDQCRHRKTKAPACARRFLNRAIGEGLAQPFAAMCGRFIHMQRGIEVAMQIKHYGHRRRVCDACRPADA